jgi:hypothetical protein
MAQNLPSPLKMPLQTVIAGVKTFRPLYNAVFPKENK